MVNLIYIFNFVVSWGKV